MAGRQNRKEVNTDLLDEIATLKAEVLQLQQKLAIADPDQATHNQTPEVTTYSDIIPKQIIALGELGLTENEMIATIHVSRENWEGWKDSFPEMAAALLRARDMALAAIDRMSRESLANRDWRFPFQNVDRTKKILMEQGGKAGDGVSLVKVIKNGSTINSRAALCPKCAADTTGSAARSDPDASSE